MRLFGLSYRDAIQDPIDVMYTMLEIDSIRSEIEAEKMK